MENHSLKKLLESPRVGLVARAAGVAIVGGFVLTLLPILEHMVPLWLERPNPSADSWKYLNDNVARLCAIFFAGCVFACLGYIARVHLPDQPTRCTRQEIASLLRRIYQGGNVSGAQYCAGVIPFLQDLGLVTDVNGSLRPVSDAANSFLRILSAHLADGNSGFIGDWSAGTSSPEVQRLRKLLVEIENHRINSAPGGTRTPSRIVRSGLALVRRDISGKPHFLMIKSDRWTDTGAWWFVGGNEESHDAGQLSNTVRREIREEMDLKDEDILEVKPLKSIKDARISKRLGVYTEYEYEMFSVQLSQTSERVQRFFVPTPKISIYYPKATREHEFGWLEWSAILHDTDLLSYAKPILDYLQTADPVAVPVTTSS